MRSSGLVWQHILGRRASTHHFPSLLWVSALQHTPSYSNQFGWSVHEPVLCWNWNHGAGASCWKRNSPPARDHPPDPPFFPSNPYSPPVSPHLETESIPGGCDAAVQPLVLKLDIGVRDLGIWGVSHPRRPGPKEQALCFPWER